MVCSKSIGIFGISQKGTATLIKFGVDLEGTLPDIHARALSCASTQSEILGLQSRASHFSQMFPDHLRSLRFPFSDEKYCSGLLLIVIISFNSKCLILFQFIEPLFTVLVTGA